MAARYNAYAHLGVVADTDIAGMTARIEAIFLSGTPELVAAGSRWYADRHEQLSQLSLLTGIPVEVLAYVCSALSPQTEWRLNYAALMQTLNAWCHEDMAPCRSATLYAANDAKAFRILQCWHNGGTMADIRRILGKGPKTHAFAPNLQEQEKLHDGNPAITIDSVTYQAGTGEVPTRGIRGKRYKRVAQCIAYLARKYGIPAYVFQAIVWCIYRGTGA